VPECQKIKNGRLDQYGHPMNTLRSERSARVPGSGTSTSWWRHTYVIGMS